MKAPIPFIEPAHVYRVPEPLTLDTESVVSQEHAHDCDVTVILSRYQRTGQLPRVAGRARLRMFLCSVVLITAVLLPLLVLLKMLLPLLKRLKLKRFRKSRITRLLSLLSNLRFLLSLNSFPVGSSEPFFCLSILNSRARFFCSCACSIL